MFSSRKAFIVICVALNIVDLNCDKKLWSSSYGPNFDPDFPQFTPFSSDQFINVESDVSVSGNSDPADVHTVDSTPVKSSAIVDQEQPNGEPQYFYTDKVVHPMRKGQFSERIQPLKNFVMGLYQNYRSTYLDNKTMYEVTPKMKDIENKLEDVELKDEPTKIKKKTKKKSKKPKFGDEVRYNVGPGVNVSLDHDKELVNVYLDEDCLKDVFTGRGKKYDLISKILPLFILPFLIQSAIVPFVVSTLKLLLVKSIVVGKIAIFLLIVSAFKNHGKYSFDAPPAYYVDPPSRRSEATAGYRVEGKPTTWVT